MSSTAKITIAIIIVILVILGVWFFMRSPGSSTPTTTPETTTTASAQPPVTQAPAPNPTVLTTAPTDDSDAALQSDLKAVGTESQNLTSDSAAIDGSFTNNSSQSAYEAQ